jgi:predicted dehydrogenase
VSVRAAVVGVGYLGRHHARLLAQLPGVDLVAVVDTNRERADEVAAACATRALYDAKDLAGTVDAVTVAVPTEVHAEVAQPLLSSGVHASARSRSGASTSTWYST